MRNILGNKLLISPAILTCCLFTFTPVYAQTIQQNSLPISSENEAVYDADLLDTNTELESELSDAGMDQITNVSQLRDVQPSDWAYESLRNLVERYGCIAGYPDSTFRGNRAITRYEFAAALNTCLTQIGQVLATADFGKKEDLVQLEKLRSEFAPELKTIGDRIGIVEARTTELENNLFSTTTKLNATLSFNLAAATAGGDVKVERIDPKNPFSAAQRGVDGRPIVTRVTDTPNTTFSHATLIFLTTSFTGKDSLITTLGAGTGNAPTNNYTSAGLFNTFGSPVFNITPAPQANEVDLLEAIYSFPISKSAQLVVSPKFFWLRYFDTNAFSSSFGKGTSGYNTYGSTLVNDLSRGAGAVLLWRFNEQFDFRAAYVAVPDASNPRTGLFENTRAFTTQLTYSPTGNVNLRFLYDRSRIKPVNGQIRNKPIIGVADDGFGGELGDATSNAFEFNFDWLVTPKFGLFGRYTYATTHLDPRRDNIADGNIRAQSVQVGVAFPDLGRRGALATLSYVLPFNVLDGREFLVSGGGNGGTQYDIEATYFFPLTDNIAIIPTFHLIGNPNNFSDNPHIYSGTVLTRFSF